MAGCGLVMKEDITQHPQVSLHTVCSCGLVMKEDITQQQETPALMVKVVVW